MLHSGATPQGWPGGWPLSFSKKKKKEKREKIRKKINKIKEINQNDLNAVYKWVKTVEFLRG